MNKEIAGWAAVVLLGAATATAWVQNHRLRLDNEDLGRRLLIAPMKAHPLEPKPVMTAAPAPAPVPADVIQAVRADDQTELETLRRQVEALKVKLSERDRQLAVATARNATNRVEGRPERGFGWGRRMSDEELAELKEKDPARYEEIERQRSEFRERVKSAAHDQVSFLESVDISSWPLDQQENHNRLLALSASLAESVGQDPESAEGGEEARRQRFERMREVGELMENERSMLLYDTARAMGLDEKGSREFADYIQTIQKVTSPRAYFPGPGRGGPPRE